MALPSLALVFGILALLAGTGDCNAKVLKRLTRSIPYPLAQPITQAQSHTPGQLEAVLYSNPQVLRAISKITNSGSGNAYGPPASSMLRAGGSTAPRPQQDFNPFGPVVATFEFLVNLAAVFLNVPKDIVRQSLGSGLNVLGPVGAFIDFVLNVVAVSVQLPKNILLQTFLPLLKYSPFILPFGNGPVPLPAVPYAPAIPIPYPPAVPYYPPAVPYPYYG